MSLQTDVLKTRTVRFRIPWPLYLLLLFNLHNIRYLQESLSFVCSGAAVVFADNFIIYNPAAAPLSRKKIYSRYRARRDPRNKQRSKFSNRLHYITINQRPAGRLRVRISAVCHKIHAPRHRPHCSLRVGTPGRPSRVRGKHVLTTRVSLHRTVDDRSGLRRTRPTEYTGRWYRIDLKTGKKPKARGEKIWIISSNVSLNRQVFRIKI